MTGPFQPAENFGGLPGKLSRRHTSAVLVLPIPYEQTTSYGSGTREGPRAILHASRNLELYDEEYRGEPAERGIHTLPAIETHAEGPVAMRRRIEEVVTSVFREGQLLVALGGEHSITPGIVDGVAARNPNITVVQFDAHADLRDSYQDTRESHACAMRRVLESHPVVSVGIRSLSSEEAAFSRARRLPSIPASAFAEPRADLDALATQLLSAIETDEVYLTFDLDALDPSILPATGTPEPGGLGWYQALHLLRALARKRRIVAADVVELAPIPGLPGPDFLAAKLVYRIMGYVLGRTIRAGAKRPARTRRLKSRRGS
jgi:agmatinase